jgi:hypothetical protein
VSLKLLVNDPKLWPEFLTELDTMIQLCYKTLEQVKDPVDIHRAQGELLALRKLQKLRDKVNAE